MCHIDSIKKPRHDCSSGSLNAGLSKGNSLLAGQDTLDLMELCFRHLVREVLIIDLERFYARSLAAVVSGAPEVREGHLGDWVSAQVSEVARQIVSERSVEFDRSYLSSRRVSAEMSDQLGLDSLISKMFNEKRHSFHLMSRQDRRSFCRGVVSGDVSDEALSVTAQMRSHVIDGLRDAIRSFARQYDLKNEGS